MSGRLASFRGPSTPTKAPVPFVASNPPSPSKTTESTYHRKVRSILVDIRAAARAWNDIVCIDGANAMTDFIDCRTELDNALLMHSDRQPTVRIVGPKISAMQKRLSDLNTVLEKLKRKLKKIAISIDNLELLLYEAHRSKGLAWVEQEPLWCTWPLERFAAELPRIIKPYIRSLDRHSSLVEELRDHDISFDHSRKILAEWVSQPLLEDQGWDPYWEDLCAVEVDQWNTK